MYGVLKEKREPESRAEALEEWVMEEAERLNEAVLANIMAWRQRPGMISFDGWLH